MTISMTLRIAFRNLREHASKTLIIGIIIAVGIMVMTIGTSLIDTATLGIERNFIENYTGNILIGGVAEGNLSLFGVQSVGGIDPTPSIPDFQRIQEHIATIPAVKYQTPQITGFAMIKKEGLENPEARGMTFLFGIEPTTYRQVFDKITILEGEFLKQDESGILLTQTNRENLEKSFGLPVNVGDKLLLTGFGNQGIRIREVEVRGFYRLLSETEGIDMSSYIDVGTLRALKGLNLGGTQEVILDKASTSLLDATDIDALFSDEAFSEDVFADAEFAQAELAPSFLDPLASPSQTQEERASTPSEVELLPVPVTGEGSGVMDPVTGSGGSFEFILLELRHARQTRAVVNELNAWFFEEGIAAQAMDWKGAAGPFSSTADVIRNVFNAAVLIVAFVALLIITNTLLISVMERKKEIGTMRALGARKSFVIRMFTYEILLISVLFGIIGQLMGIGVLGIISLIGFQAGNALVEILFAGPVLRPVIHLSTLAINLVIVIIIGVIANIYPVSVALGIEPVKAISST